MSPADEMRSSFLGYRAQGLSVVESVRQLRESYDLSISEAKEVAVLAEGLADSLEEYQAKLFPDLEAALAMLDDSSEAG